MAIPGNWQLHFDWNSDGSYSTESMTFNNDGTWNSSGGFSGRWVHVEGMFILNFSTSGTIYTGLVASSSVTGNMTTFGTGDGSWYMVKAGAPEARKVGGDRSLAGEQRNQ
jgi:hypothetical protein